MNLYRTFITTGENTGRKLVFIPLDEQIQPQELKRHSKAPRRLKRGEEENKVKTHVMWD